MKKLMIAAAIVCVAAFAQAATFTWGSTDNSKPCIYDWNGDGAPAVGYVEFFVNDSLVTTSTAFDENGEATFSGVGLSDGDVVKAVAHVTNFSDGEGFRAWEYTFTDAWYNTQPGATEAGMALVSMMNNDFDADGNGIDFSAGIAANGYTAVPEPTSGFLLLLGVAGLALRRRRA